MKAPARVARRYEIVTQEKSGGATYTPKILADFVAQRIVEAARKLPSDRPLRILDPGVGNGELLISLLDQLSDRHYAAFEICGFETDENALNIASARIKQRFPAAALNFQRGNFLDFVLEHFSLSGTGNPFRPSIADAYDLIIANPPYVRTQIMGATQAQLLAAQFGLSGRVDLYYAFILGMAQVLKPQGIAGMIVSNRFMTTKSGAAVRQAFLERFNVRHVWDLGDTKLFEAAVLPAVLLVEGKNGHAAAMPTFTSIYQTTGAAQYKAKTPVDALSGEGVVAIDDGRCFQIQQGKLDTSGARDGVWRIATQAGETWLKTVEQHTWGIFRDIGKIRVGVKTCADKIFIRSDWQDMPEADRPELLKPLTTHHIARRFKPLAPEHTRQILYPHEFEGQRRAVDLSRYPRSKAYLERCRDVLQHRKYVIEAGREWYEIWVPQDPAAWGETKLVFRDIAEQPTFWIDQAGTIVNGDCYWLVCEEQASTDLLWLAVAVANSPFIERFYDCRFHNKLYAGRRRFMTQYVEQFPLPEPGSSVAQAIMRKAKQVYESIPSPEADTLKKDLDRMVCEAFGLAVEEVAG